MQYKNGKTNRSFLTKLCRENGAKHLKDAPACSNQTSAVQVSGELGDDRDGWQQSPEVRPA